MSLNLKALRVCLCFIALFTGWASGGARASLFFEDAHVAQIQRARTGKSAAQDMAPIQTTYRLSGILYTSPSTWKIWVNGKVYAPARFPDLSVTSVSAAKASFFVRTKKTSHAFTLKINETFTVPD